MDVLSCFSMFRMRSGLEVEKRTTTSRGSSLAGMVKVFEARDDVTALERMFGKTRRVHDVGSSFNGGLGGFLSSTELQHNTLPLKTLVLDRTSPKL